MTKDEALKLALEALKTLMIERGSIYDKAIAAIEEVLAQPENGEKCHDCGGMGYQDGIGDRCPTCNGFGQQPEQEPVAILSNVSRDEYLTRFYIGSQQTIRYLEIENQQLLSSGKVWKNEGSRLIAERDAFKAEVQLLKAQLAQPSDSVEQEPKYRCCPHDSDCAVHSMPAYPAGPCDCTYKDQFNTPPQREPLTDEQIDAAVDAWFKPVAGPRPFARRMRAAIEAAHGIKERNT